MPKKPAIKYSIKAVKSKTRTGWFNVELHIERASSKFLNAPDDHVYTNERLYANNNRWRGYVRLTHYNVSFPTRVGEVKNTTTIIELKTKVKALILADQLKNAIQYRARSIK
jgi:hypothetical protein